MRNVLKISILFILMVILLCNNCFSLKSELSNTITVYVNEIKYELLRGSTYADLLKRINDYKNLDYNILSLDFPLYNNQIINLQTKSINKISINTNDVNELIRLSGIGLITANKIIEYRRINGDFCSLEELMNVSGIGLKKYEKIKEQITL